MYREKWRQIELEKDNFNANVDFVRGQADMIVLSALADNDKYGLEILNTIQERSQGMYSLKQATLYSSLKRLEKNGYVQSYDGDVSNGAKRVYYGLTEQGRDHLNNDKSYWEFCNFLMSNLISDSKFDPQNEEKPFDPADFRPLTRRNKSSSENEKVVIKYVYLPQDANSELKNQEDITALPEEESEEIVQTILDENNTNEDEEVENKSVIEDSGNSVEENNEILEENIEDESLFIANDGSEEVVEEIESIEQDTKDEQPEEIVEKELEQEVPSPIYQHKQYFDENNEINYISSFSNMFNSIPEDLPIEDEKEQ